MFGIFVCTDNKIFALDQNINTKSLLEFSDSSKQNSKCLSEPSNTSTIVLDDSEKGLSNSSDTTLSTLSENDGNSDLVKSGSTESVRISNNLSNSKNNVSDKNKINNKRTSSKTVRPSGKSVSRKTQDVFSSKTTKSTQKVNSNTSKTEEKQEKITIQSPQEQNGNSTDSFEFIKSDKFKGGFFEDEHILLYGGIFLILVSIIGLFITFMPRKKRRR